MLAFEDDMVMGSFSPTERAPAYLVFANAGRDAYYEQMQRDPAEAVMVPETA